MLDICSGLWFQMVQRTQQRVEEKQKQLEERGVMVEKILRGEPGEAVHAHARTHTQTVGYPGHLQSASSGVGVM